MRVLNRIASARARSEESYIGVRFFTAFSLVVLYPVLDSNLSGISCRLNKTLDLPPEKSPSLDWLLLVARVGFLISTASEGICLMQIFLASSVLVSGDMFVLNKEREMFSSVRYHVWRLRNLRVVDDTALSLII